MSYVPVFDTVNALPIAVKVDELILVVFCTTCVFLDVPLPSYDPVTPKMLTSFLMFPAVRLASVRVFVALLA